ncbi:hypothetical protein CLUG_05915 [Clavispora lusitaniae ATCC 42720]|uniref:Zn(2)-C6 fungal-type domain-containing protein n=2 Tax=Clavispora lusitaniae TaxID=36911 RepID=C4YC98_CLAL4|nr:uncharacterized protein CLUG_05915 [Clavispora lusitaniae ATCC 42720]EEQ41787.1 hypothetical protein CLUG_05915 [Clavispora lusitaniae ATCC 42720]
MSTRNFTLLTSLTPMSVNYKSYQQVFSLTSGCKRTSTTKPKARAETVTKKRTKTGCLTCRRRKKKCDEVKVDGKCQACIRNFMDCCWSEEAKQTESVSPAVVATEKKPQSTKGASAYPSPIQSPRVSADDSGKEIKPLELPPSKYKITKPGRPKKQAKMAQFVVTSFGADRELCQIKS